MDKGEANTRRFLWPVSREIQIAAPAALVWNTISKPGNLELCHPFCERNPVDHWPGKDSVDRIQYLNGLRYERRFYDWIEGTGYDLQILRGTRRQADVSWRITVVDDSNSTLRITVFPEAFQQRPVAIRWIPHLFVLRPKLSSYLDSVLRGFEWYITKGEAVPRNQFGEHPWYSRRKN